jgi:DNA primase
LETLSSEEHALLCNLSEPHGPLFTWLESYLHDHGHLPLDEIRSALAQQPFGEFALRVLGEASPEPGTAEESAAELRDLVNRMLIERLKAQETEAIEASRTDPTALERYRQLQLRRLQIEKLAIDGIILG